MKPAAFAAALLLAATGAGAEGRLHEVRPGESLAGIARRELGDPALWPLLYRANRDRIKDPERIYPGQQISIPPPAPGPAGAAPDAPDALPEDDE